MIGTPIESTATGEKVVYEVTYTEDGKVEKVDKILGAKPEVAEQTKLESGGTNFTSRD